MRKNAFLISLMMLATSVSAQVNVPEALPPRAGALTLRESDSARNPIPAKRNQLIDLYLPTQEGMEWKVTKENMIKVDGVIVPSFFASSSPAPTVGTVPGTSATTDSGVPIRTTGRPQPTIVRIQLSDMAGYWGMTMVYSKKATRGKAATDVKSVPFKFVVN